jgi:hypothetical protein
MFKKQKVYCVYVREDGDGPLGGKWKMVSESTTLEAGTLSFTEHSACRGVVGEGCENVKLFSATRVCLPIIGTFLWMKDAKVELTNSFAPTDQEE